MLESNGATKGAAQKVLEELGRRGLSVLNETAQEVAQEGATVAGVQAASYHDRGKPAYTGREVGKRLLDTAGASVLFFWGKNHSNELKSSVAEIVRPVYTMGGNLNSESKAKENEIYGEHQRSKSAVAEYVAGTPEKNGDRPEIPGGSPEIQRENRGGRLAALYGNEEVETIKIRV